jgi:hypothetical protein
MRDRVAANACSQKSLVADNNLSLAKTAKSHDLGASVYDSRHFTIGLRIVKAKKRRIVWTTDNLRGGLMAIRAIDVVVGGIYATTNNQERRATKIAKGKTEYESRGGNVSRAST